MNLVKVSDNLIDSLVEITKNAKELSQRYSEADWHKLKDLLTEMDKARTKVFQEYDSQFSDIFSKENGKFHVTIDSKTISAIENYIKVYHECLIKLKIISQ